MMDCPVSVSVDITLPMAPTPHDYFGAFTAYVAKVPGIGIEAMCCNLKWIGGMIQGKSNVASSVTHRSCAIVQDGNDLGMLVPQITMAPAPDNILSLMHLLTSQCKVTFSAGDTLAEGKPVALIMPALMPMICCGEPVQLPAIYCISNATNSVKVTPNEWDVRAGWATALATIVVSAVKSHAFSSGSNDTTTAHEILGPIFGNRLSLAAAPLDAIPSVAGALVRMAGRRADPTYKAPISVQVQFQQGAAVDESVTYTETADGAESIQVQRNAGAGVVGDQRTARRAPDGTRRDVEQTRTGWDQSDERSLTPPR